MPRPGCPKRRVLLAALLLLQGLCQAAGNALTLACPERITTRQSLQAPVAGWRASQQRPFSAQRTTDAGDSENNLDHVDFSIGPPEELVTLAPDRQSPTQQGRWTSTWMLSKSQEVWFSCHYRGTTVVLSQPLPAALTRCSAQYDMNRGIAIERVSCQ